MKKLKIQSEETVETSVVSDVCETCKGTGRHLPEKTCPVCNGTGKK